MIDVVTAKRLAERYKILYSKAINLSSNIDGFTPPSNLVTEYEYPKVFLGFLFTREENIENYDNPELLSDKNLDIDEIIKYRVSLINARKITDVNLPRKNDPLYEKILEASLSIKSVNVEVLLKNIKENNRISKIISYYGFNGRLNDIKINENPKIPGFIDNINDIKAEDAVLHLYRKGLSDYYLSRLFSLGFFGLDINKKLVPSKWSITAVHSILYSKIRKEVMEKGVKVADKIYLFNYYLYGNNFYGILLPGNGKIELIEILLPGCAYNMNGKNSIIGRDDESGGYYAVKLSFMDFVNSSKIYGDFIVVRIIDQNYKLPLGVWVVREGTKRMFRNLVDKFESRNELFRYLNNLILNKYGISFFKIKKYSNVLNQKNILDSISF